VRPELVEGIHREPRAEDEEVRRYEDGEGCQALGEAPTAELPGHQTSQHHYRGAGQGGEEV
jgi:hypothetical protein